MSARYLLRLDDACPTMDHARWGKLEAVFDACGVKPIVAVVPDNRDPYLEADAANPAFWSTARAWQDKGWTIGLHGYQHVMHAHQGAQYLPLHPRSEFAGLSMDKQADKIRRGWAEITAQGLRPTIWVAPAHSFDRATLLALRQETPIRIVSDGVARNPFQLDDCTWIPQQLWSLTPKRDGLWTVCLHPNTMDDAAIARLQDQLRGPFAGKVIGLDAIAMTDRRRSMADRVEEVQFWRRHHTGRAVNRIKKLVGR